MLLAYGKMALYERILETDIPDDPYLVHDVGLYFPKPLRKRFLAFVPHHRLRREITATYVTNSLINRAGPTFISDTAEKTGASDGDITKAYLITRQVFALPRMWADIEGLDNQIPAEVQTELTLSILRLIRRATLWILRSGPRPLDITLAIHRFGPGVSGLSAALGDLVTPELGATLGAEAERYVGHGAPERLARAVANLDVLFSGLDIVRIAAGGYDVGDVAKVYFAIGDRFGLDWLRGAAEGLSAETEWQELAIGAIIDDLYAQQTALVSKVVDESGGGAAAEAIIEAWASSNGHRVNRAVSVVSELKTTGSVDLAMLAVANREIRALLAR